MKTITLEEALKRVGDGPNIMDFIPRRPYEDHRPHGYLESDRDWFENNRELVVWMMENFNLLAHCYNHFEEVVARLQWYKEMEDQNLYYGPLQQNETEAILAKATTITMPT